MACRLDSLRVPLKPILYSILLFLPGLAAAQDAVFTHAHLSVPDREAAAVWHQTPGRGRAIDHMGWRIPDVQAFAKKIEAAGHPAELIRPNEDGSTLLFFAGAGHVYFEMAQPPPSSP